MPTSPKTTSTSSVAFESLQKHPGNYLKLVEQRHDIQLEHDKAVRDAENTRLKLIKPFREEIIKQETERLAKLREMEEAKIDLAGARGRAETNHRISSEKTTEAATTAKVNSDETVITIAKKQARLKQEADLCEVKIHEQKEKEAQVLKEDKDYQGLLSTIDELKANLDFITGQMGVVDLASHVDLVNIQYRRD